MAEPLLCLLASCALPGRHRDGCTDDVCRGCQPAQAADGLNLCRLHTDRIPTDAAAAAVLYDELALRLLGGTGGGEPVSGTADRTRLPNPAAVDARATIRHTLVAWCRLIAEQRGFALPDDDVHAMAAYVARSATWLAATDYADEAADELHQLAHGRMRAVAYPTGARVVEIAPCPHDGCGGTVKAILRPADSLLPSELACDRHDEHRWPASAWREFRRAVEGRAA